jgi:putative MATE family efflux protein
MSNDLTSAPIPRLIRRLAIPAGTGFFFNTMFNVVDIWYGGKLSTTALAAMSLSFPVFFIILSCGNGISTGTTTLIGNAFGRGSHQEAETYIRQSISFTILNTLLITIMGLLLSPAIFKFMGADGDYLRLSLGYMNIIFAGSLFFMLNFVMGAILNAQGNTVPYRNFLVGGFFLNLLLDPWLMYGGFGVPRLGLPGIALATVLIHAMGNLYLFRCIFSNRTGRTFRLQELTPSWHHYGELARQGFPAALNMMTVSLGIFIITWFVGRYGQEAVAAYGIATRIEQIALLPVMGLNVSTLALTAQNFGARRTDRIRQILAISLRYGFIMASIGTLIALIFSTPLISFFTSDKAVIEIGVQCLKIEALIFPAYVLLYICVSAMQGIKQPLFALWVGLYRQIAAPVTAFYLLATVLGWGITGIWWGVFSVTWSAALLVVIYVSWMLRKLDKDLKEGLA